jgi:hypothetical protein
LRQSEEIDARRLGIVIEQYVEARKRRYDYVSTEQASRAIHQVLTPAISDRELDDMIATLAIKNGLAVIFDRGSRASTDNSDRGRKRSLPKATPVKPRDVAAAVDAILADTPENVPVATKEVISLLREHTGTDRSDADLDGLIRKKAALRGVHLLQNG